MFSIGARLFSQWVPQGQGKPTAGGQARASREALQRDDRETFVTDVFAVPSEHSFNFGLLSHLVYD